MVFLSLQLDLLVKAALENRLAHLLLFHGGSSKERAQFASRLAKISNCLSPSPKGSCDSCTVCRKIEAGNHPDVDVLTPQKASLGIEQILLWQDKVYRKHYEGKYKVFLIEKADLLTIAAGNALLKVVEEPPARTIIILSADNVEQILPTLQSRAQSIYFSEPAKEVWMGEFEGCEEFKAEEAFRISRGHPELASRIIAMGLDKVTNWIAQFREALSNKNFLQLFSLFPVEKEQAHTYMIVMANMLQEEMLDGTNHAEELLGISRAIERLRQQVNPRLVIEVLALELFQQGGRSFDRGRGRSL